MGVGVQFSKSIVLQSFVFVLSVHFSLAEQPREFDFDVEVTGSLIAYNRRADVRVDVEPIDLPAGKKGRIKVLLNNQMECDWDVHTINTRCSCLSAKLSDSRINRGDAISLEVIIETPPRSATGEFRTEITLKASASGGEHKEMGASLFINFGLEGMIAFPQKLHAFEVYGTKDVEFDVPFVSTVKGSEKGLSLTLDNRLTGIDAALSTDRNASAIVITVDPNVLPEVGGYGVLRLMDRETGVADETTVVVTRRLPVSVSPGTLRFVRDKDFYRGKAIIKVYPAAYGLNEEQAKKINASRLSDVLQKQDKLPETFIHATSNLGSLTFEVHRLSSLIYRVDLAFPVPNENETAALASEATTPLDSTHVKWEFVTMTTKSSVTSKVVIAPDDVLPRAMGDQ